MDALRPAVRILAAAGVGFALLSPAGVHAEGAEVRAEEAGTRAEKARARVGLGVGGTSLVPVSHGGAYRGVVAAGAWGALSLGTHLQLTPSITLYRVTAYGSGPGWKTDLSLGLEYVIARQRFRFVPGVLLSLTRAGVVIGGPRGVGAGVSLALQVPVSGQLEIFARSEHRFVVTTEEAVLVNQVVFGPALGF